MSRAATLRAKAFGTEASGMGPQAAGRISTVAGSGTAKEPGAPANTGARPAPFRVRFHAWWNGLDTTDLVAPQPKPASTAKAAPPATASAAPTAPDAAAWSEARVRAAELVLGDDCRTPIGPDVVVETLKPLGLTPAKAVLDVGAGLGNAARQIASRYGAWVSGLESSECLAAEGMARSAKANMAKKAPIAHVDFEALEKPQKSFDCVFSREAFYTVQHKQALLQTLVDALKGGGELVFTDYFLRATGLESAAVQEWRAGEPLATHPWSIDQMIEQLRALKLDVRVTEDFTRGFRDLIVKRLELLVTKNELAAGDPVQAQQLLHEVELWGRRVKALDSGDIQVYRIIARKSADADGKIRALSNW